MTERERDGREATYEDIGELVGKVEHEYGATLAIEVRVRKGTPTCGASLLIARVRRVDGQRSTTRVRGSQAGEFERLVALAAKEFDK